MSVVYIRNTNQSIRHEKEFREKCARDFKDAARPIKNIAVVGVARPAFFGFNGGDEDSVRIRHVLNYLAQNDTPIHSAFDLDAISFTNGRDFLKEDKAYDMVFVSCIPVDAKSARSDMVVDDAALPKYEQAGMDTIRAHQLAGALSDRHSAYNWSKRLARTGAQLCVTFGGQDEISTQDLRQEGYEEILPTPDRRIVEWKNRYESAQEFYGMPNDYPMLWLGMMKKKVP